MASVTLTDLWLHDATDFSTFIKIRLNKMSTAESQIEGQVRRYSGGRLRFVRRPGQKDSLTISLVEVDQSFLDTLRDWAGNLILYRDPKGRKIFGTYRAVNVSEAAGEPTKVRTVSFVVEEISETEEV